MTFNHQKFPDVNNIIVTLITDLKRSVIPRLENVGDFLISNVWFVQYLIFPDDILTTGISLSSDENVYLL